MEVRVGKLIYFFIDVDPDEVEEAKGALLDKWGIDTTTLKLDIGGSALLNSMIEFELDGYKFSGMLHHLPYIFKHIASAQQIQEGVVTFLLYPIGQVFMSTAFWPKFMDKMALVIEEKEDEIMGAHLNMEEILQNLEENKHIKRDIPRE